MNLMALTATMPDTVLGWLTLGGFVLGAAWAIYTFRHNTRSKHAEIVLKLEENYRAHLPTMLKVEYIREYEATFKKALRRANSSTDTTNRAEIGYTEDESKAIDALEIMLRHFLMALHLRELKVARHAIDRSHAYYLRLFIDEYHPELRTYLRRFWASVYFWAELAGQPWLKRILIYRRQLPERLRIWWLAKASEPDRARRVGEPALEEASSANLSTPPSDGV